MKRYFFCFIILLCSEAGFTQGLNKPQKVTDSLMQRFASEKKDSVKAVVAFDLVKRLARIDSIKSYEYLEKGKQHIGNSVYLEGLYHFSVAQYYFDTDRDRCNKALMKAIAVLAKIKTKDSFKLQAKAWFNYVVQNQHTKGDDFAVGTILEKSIPLVEKSGDSLLLADNYFQVGLLFMNNQEYKKASQYYELATNMLANAPADSPLPLRIMTLWADNYLYASDYKKAKEKLDEAKKMLKWRASEREYLDYYYAEGIYYNETGRHEEALASFNKGLATPRDEADPYVRRTLAFEKVNVLDSLHQYHEGKSILMEFLKEGSFTESINNKMLVYHKLAYFNEKLGDYKPAYFYVRKYLTLKDSLYSSQLNEGLHELELKYNDAKNKAKIETLKVEKANVRFYNTLLGIGCLFSITAATVFWFFYKNKKKLSEQKEINYLQQLKHVQQEKELEVFRAVVQGEERERMRVARELHDGMGGLLIGVKVNLNSIYDTENLEQEAKGRVKESLDRLDDSITELRSIAANMTPAALLHSGVKEALEDFCTSISGGDKEVIFQAKNMQELMLPDNEKIMIFRIVQELVTNAIKHASATRILVDCVYADKKLSITVEDNGKGFDAKLVSFGMGLSNVRSRAEALNANLDIQSEVGGGTTALLYYDLENVTAQTS